MTKTKSKEGMEAIKSRLEAVKEAFNKRQKADNDLLCEKINPSRYFEILSECNQVFYGSNYTTHTTKNLGRNR